MFVNHLDVVNSSSVMFLESEGAAPIFADIVAVGAQDAFFSELSCLGRSYF